MKIGKKKRAVSPVVATILMFALTLGAISISLVYMFPNLTLFKESSYNNATRLYFTSLDTTIQNMLDNNPPVSKRFDFYQEDGSLYFDNSWRVFFFMNDVTGGANNLILNENMTRLIHKTTNTEDYSEGEHRYLIGPEDQDYLFINGSSTLFNEITVLNESRTIFDPSNLYLALYYRYTLNINYDTEGDTENYYIDVIHVDINTEEIMEEEITTKGITMQLNYAGTSKEKFEPIRFTHDLEGEVRTVNEYNTIQMEYPVYLPTNSLYSYHYLHVNVIKIQLNINLQ